MSDELIPFLEKWVETFKVLEALGDAAAKAETAGELGDNYREYVEQVRDAFTRIDKTRKDVDRQVAKNPRLGKDVRLPWLRAINMALLKASSHRQPPKNSHNLPNIRNAVYVSNMDLSHCRFDLEEALKRARGAGGSPKSG